MSQTQIYEFLKAHPNQEFTGREISEAVKYDRQAIYTQLKKLRRVPYIHFNRKFRPKQAGPNTVFVYSWRPDA